jgi:hypothetical protein
MTSIKKIVFLEMAGGSGVCYTPYAAISSGSGPTSLVYVSTHQNRKKWSRAVVIGSSLLVLLAVVSVMRFSDHDKASRVSMNLGGVYYNVFTGKPVEGSFYCSPGSYKRSSEDGHTLCVDCPIGQVHGKLVDSKKK